MAIKAKLNAFEINALPEALKSEYKLQSDGSYKLDLADGFITDRDPSQLMNALELERNEHKQTKSKFDDIVRERDEAKKAAQLAELQKTGNAEDLKKFFGEQLEAQKREWEARQKAQEEQIQKQKQVAAEQYRKTKAMEIASELFGPAAPAFVPAILQGLTAKPTEFGQDPILEIVNEQGLPVLGATLESYKQTFLTNPVYKPMIVASKASGGSANERTTNASGLTQDGKTKRFDDYSSGELVELLRQNPVEYERLKSLRNSK